MRSLFHARILAAHVRQERRSRLPQSALRARQQAELTRLREWTVANSPFYARFHRGREHAPLEELPVLDKATLMEEFDHLVTDRRVRLSGVLAHLEASPGERYLGRYVVLATSGSTGRKGVFLFDRHEWIDALGAITRPPAWAGAPAPWTRPRAAVLASTEPWHYSGRIARDLATALMPTLHADASWPLEQLIERLNGWRPDVLALYPSILSALADAQRVGVLQIAPRHIATSAEVLSDRVRAEARAAFGIDVHNTYGATELAPIAAQCRAGYLHLFDDRAVIEVVDDDGAPVPPGETGAQLLLTVFGRFTQPLIRYALSDHVRELPGLCVCGRASRRLAMVEGRAEESLVLPPMAGEYPIVVHPNSVHHALESVTCTGWQVRQIDARIDGDPPSLDRLPRLHVVLTGTPHDDMRDRLAHTLRRLLAERGARIGDVRVEWVESIPRGATGKAPLIVRVSDRPPA